MATIDRYVVGLFLKVFLASFVSIFAIYLVGDFVNNLAEFIDAGGDAYGVVNGLLQHYGPRIPWLFDLTGRIIVVISAVFVVTWLHRHNEMAALMAAGISRFRIVKPIVVTAGLLSLIAVINREIVIPPMSDSLSCDAQDRVGDGGHEFEAVFDNQTSIWFAGEKAYSARRRVSKPTLELPAHLQQFGQTIIAQWAEYHDELRTGRPNGYLLTGVSQPRSLDKIPSFQINGQRVVLSPSDTDWLAPDQCFVVTDLSFDQLKNGHRWKKYCSTVRLIASVRRQPMQFGPDTRLLIHARIVQPLIDMTLVFLGLPIVLKRGSNNVFVSAGLCILMVAGFFVIVIASHAFGVHELRNPAFAAWLPLMILVPWAVYWSGAFGR